MPNIRVLMVDDEYDLVSVLSENLNEEEGFTADFEVDPERVVEKLNEFRPDVLIMDKLMPRKNGIEVINEVKSRMDYMHLPVIMLTACKGQNDVVACFESGVDDFIPKPFNFEEFKMRIKAVYKRSSTSADQTLSFENIQMDVLAQTVFVGDKEVTLTLAEYKMLKLFLTNLHRVLSRDELCDAALGGTDHISSRTVDVHITSLRKKLMDSASFIKTVRGTGYKMTAEALKKTA